MITITRTTDVTETVEKIIKEALQVDGESHKQWYLEFLAETLDIDLSQFAYDEGRAP